MKAVGIDLGTTNSAVAHLDEFDRPVIVPNSLNQPTTPSVICFHDGDVVVGEEAKELQRAGEPDIAAFFKRQMGVPGFAFFAGGSEHSAADLSAVLLAKLKEEAETTLGTSIGHAVITVPAYFRNPQREATIEAGRNAGLEVLQVINEPTAAAIAYGFGGRRQDGLHLVYDLGGGTFDVTLLRIGSEEVRVLASDGDHELGGKDWDLRIVEHVGGLFEEEFGRDPFEDAESAAVLLVAAEDAKKRLSSVTKTTISLSHQGDRGRFELDLQTLNDLTSDLMERTISLTERVLEDRGLTPQELSSVLLVGGSTRMKMVHEFINERLGVAPSPGVNVDEAVALGAALTAARAAPDRQSGTRLALAGPTRTIDVTNHSLGMIAVNDDRSRFVNSLILPKNTEIPATLSRPFQYPVRGRNRDLDVYVTQGESDSPQDVTYLGRYVFRQVPPSSAGPQVIDIEYQYDVSGTVNVAATLREGGQQLEVVVEPVPDDVPDRFLQPPDAVGVMQHCTVYLAFDLSGSMTGAPLIDAQRAAKRFLQNLDLAHCSMGLCTFADRVQIVAEATQNARQLQRAIDGLSIGSVGYGNATDPFPQLLAELRDTDDPRFIVALADGVWSRQELAIQRAESCQEEGIEVIAIGFGGADEAFLRKIASSDESSLLTSQGNLTQAFESVAQVITETGGRLTSLDSRHAGTGGALSLFGRKRR